MEERVFKVFKATFGIADDVNKDDVKYNEYPGWDSVAHMTLVADLEEEFDAMLETDDILDMSSFAKAVEIMSKYND